MRIKVKGTSYRLLNLLDASDEAVKNITGKTKAELRKEYGIEKPVIEKPAKEDVKDEKKDEKKTK